VRENRTHGSEGGEGESPSRPLSANVPISLNSGPGSSQGQAFAGMTARAGNRGFRGNRLIQQLKNVPAPGRAGAEEARKAGLRSGTHPQGNEGIKNAIRAGINIIDHGVFLDEEAIELMKKTGAGLVPTLSAPFNIIQAGPDAGVPDFAVQKTRSLMDAHFKSALMARDAGIPIGMGTDAGTPLNRHGKNLSELLYMTQIGFSPEEALISPPHPRQPGSWA
jgi:hypothetical protein